MDTHSTPILKIRDLTKVYRTKRNPFAKTGGRVVALDHISLEINAGEIFGLVGESGSGKQVVAEHIHGSSPRRTGPFVYINCVAISEDLVESTDTGVCFQLEYKLKDGLHATGVSLRYYLGLDDTIADNTGDEVKNRVHFGDLTPLYPQERLTLETDTPLLQSLD